MYQLRSSSSGAVQASDSKDRILRILSVIFGYRIYSLEYINVRLKSGAAYASCGEGENQITLIVFSNYVRTAPGERNSFLNSTACKVKVTSRRSYRAP